MTYCNPDGVVWGLAGMTNESISAPLSAAGGAAGFGVSATTTGTLVASFG